MLGQALASPASLIITIFLKWARSMCFVWDCWNFRVQRCFLQTKGKREFSRWLEICPVANSCDAGMWALPVWSSEAFGFFLCEIVQWEFRYREENVKNADCLRLCALFLAGRWQTDFSTQLKLFLLCSSVAARRYMRGAKSAFTEKGKRDFCAREVDGHGCSTMYPVLA